MLMEKQEYSQGLLSMLRDEKVYKAVGRDPTKKFQDRANEFVKELKKHNTIDEVQSKKLITLNAVPPKIYGLRKTHKTNFSMRPIVSCIGTPCYKLASFLHTILAPITTTSPFNVKNSFEFVEFSTSIILPPNYKLISLDVVSLFTNIPKSLIIQIFASKWRYISAYFDIPKNVFFRYGSFLF